MTPRSWWAGPLLGVICVLALPPLSAEAQFSVRDLVVTGGTSAEGYRGNLPAVSVPAQDSTEFVSAVVGEVGTRVDLLYQTPRHGSLSLAFDGGLRQFAARGFELTDYAPREWVGTLDLAYARPLGERAGVTLRSRLRGRDVEDRPPMPLFLQPGYRSAEVGLALDVDGPFGIQYDLAVSADRRDFMAPQLAPQIRLLNRDAVSGEVGVLLPGGPTTYMRLFGAFEASRYPDQNTFAPEDPFRRDRNVQGGVSWTYEAEHLLQLTVEGRANRSNSRRPEYDAVTFRGIFTTSLPGSLAFSAFGALTAKQYLHPSEFARLLPGEEANSASLAFISLTRALARNLDGAVRIGWTHAETEIGEEYFERFGASFYLHFRPL